MSIAEADFQYIRDLVYQASGNVLEDKRYLVESRLEALMRSERFDSVSDLLAKLREQPNNGLRWRLIESMTNAETYFFRDLYPFELLKKSVLPELVSRRARERRLDIWCAAASSGQEPYSILMLLDDHFPALSGWDINLLASDISKRMLDRCAEGRYSQTEINRGLPAAYVVKYFEKKGMEWQVKDKLRRLLKTRQISLTQPWPALPMMDVIFVRNILIYLDLVGKRAITENIRKILRPDGYVFLGGAEAMLNIDDGFERLQIDRGICYRLRGH